MLPSLSSWAAVHCGLLVLAQQSLAANPQISTDLFQKFVRYARFSAASYADSCPNSPYRTTVANFFNVASLDTQGYLFRDDAAKELILALRGTSDIQDFIIDFTSQLTAYNSVGVSGCDDCQVHTGFLEAWNSASSEVITAINTQLASHSGYALKVTCHSLGGSLASLASASLVGVSLNPTTYTFGPPRTGNPAYANMIDRILPLGKVFRVTHSNDGVPQMIPTSDGHRHHPTEFWENDPAGASTTVQCSGQEPLVS
ncbi:Alpha/Beta hydrolase fold [Hyaloscypha variabilis]